MQYKFRKLHTVSDILFRLQLVKLKLYNKIKTIDLYAFNITTVYLLLKFKDRLKTAYQTDK